MIRTETEYRRTQKKLQEQNKLLEHQRREMASAGLNEEQQNRVLNPVRCFQLQLQEEMAAYERLQQGKIDPVTQFSQIGRLLISLRIAKGVTQRELAERLNVNESQVSRDEHNEYHGITVDRAQRILDVLQAAARIEVVPDPSQVG